MRPQPLSYVQETRDSMEPLWPLHRPGNSFQPSGPGHSGQASGAPAYARTQRTSVPSSSWTSLGRSKTGPVSAAGTLNGREMRGFLRGAALENLEALGSCEAPGGLGLRLGTDPPQNAQIRNIIPVSGRGRRKKSQYRGVGEGTPRRAGAHGLQREPGQGLLWDPEPVGKTDRRK